jgi:hypothetical protein
MLVQELLRDLARIPDEDAFIARFPRPALLIEPYGESRPGAVDTPSSAGAGARPGPRESTTEVLGALEAARHMARLSEAVHPEAKLEWLAKTERNPFGALITVGRARNNDVVLEHPTISKLHVIFTQLTGGWHVSDERSANGTFLNGVRLTPGEKRPVQDGDSLRFGPDIVGRFFEPESLHTFLKLLRGAPPQRH